MNPLEELLGVKRAAYALLTGQRIDARLALEWGMVNEVLPRDQLLGRAWKLADHIMGQPRVTRRLTTQIVRRPWKRRITDDLDGGFGIQMFAHLAKNQAIHDADHALAAAAAGKRLFDGGRHPRPAGMIWNQSPTGNVPRSWRGQDGPFLSAENEHRLGRGTTDHAGSESKSGEFLP